MQNWCEDWVTHPLTYLSPTLSRNVGYGGQDGILPYLRFALNALKIVLDKSLDFYYTNFSLD